MKLIHRHKYTLIPYHMVAKQKTSNRKEVKNMAEFYFTNRDDLSNRKPRKRKRQNRRKRPSRIVRVKDGLVYKEIIYEDGKIVLEKKDISSANPKTKKPGR
jgi:hypothetical protein